MNKTPKSKVERFTFEQIQKRIDSHKYVERDISAVDVPTPSENAGSVAMRSPAADNIIARMEEMQQCFGRFAPAGRLQLTDREAEAAFDESVRTFDGEDAEAWQEQSERQGNE